MARILSVVGVTIAVAGIMAPRSAVSQTTDHDQDHSHAGEPVSCTLAPPISLDSRLAKTAGPERKGRDGPEAEGEQGDRRS